MINCLIKEVLTLLPSQVLLHLTFQQNVWKESGDSGGIAPGYVLGRSGFGSGKREGEDFSSHYRVQTTFEIHTTSFKMSTGTFLV